METRPVSSAGLASASNSSTRQPTSSRPAWKSYGILDGYIDSMAGLYGFVKAGYMATPVDGVQQVLGRSPITFEQYATDYAAKFKA